ncbi:putative ribonuclease H-like domain-containing protein, partial [Tanacetum coccineum]
IPALEEIYDNPTNGIFTNSSYDNEDAVADFTNLEPVMNASPIPTSRINSIHPSTLILGDPQSAVQTRKELLQFKIQKVWILVNLPYGKKAIGTKWVYRNKKDKRGVVVRNKARLVAQGHRKEEGIDYDEVFAHVARIKAIRIFLAFASYIGFIVYQMDVKSAFLYGKIDEESLVCYFICFLVEEWIQRGTIDKTLFIKKDKHDIILVQVYFWDDIIFDSTKKSWCDDFEALMQSRFQMSSMGELTFFLRLQVKQKKDGIFISQDKYVAEILKKFNFVSVKTASTPIETHKPLVKDEEASDVDVHLYRSMIGSLMYLTASRPDIMFVVCACSRFQVTPKTYHLSAVKRIFRRLISWQCKKQTIMATSTTEAEYVAATNCRGQVLWIQNQIESLGRAYDCTEALLLPKLFILWLAKVSTDSAKLVPLGKDSTATETLKKIPPRSFMRLFIFLLEAPFIMLSLLQAVSISEASIRSNLLFDDADGIDSLPNQAIFDAIQLMIRPIWNNVQRVNHQNQFVPTAVLTRTGKIPVSTARASGTNNVSTARHNFNRQAVPTNAAMKVNTVKPIVNRVRPKTVFHKTHSPFSRPFNNTTALRTNFSYQKVNTAEDYPHRALQNKGIVDSGCSRHMTGNKAYLAEYQDFNGGPVAFGGSKGYITGKGKIKTGKLDFEDVCFVKELFHGVIWVLVSHWEELKMVLKHCCCQNCSFFG